MQTMQQFCLRWNNHQPNFISVFTTLLTDETLVDVTLACEGKHLQAHRVVLSACSAYFQSLFTVNPCQHPIVILKDIKFSDLKTMVDFMYYGEVNVSQEQLPAILKIAEMLKIKGLADMPSMSDSLTGKNNIMKENRRSSSPMSPATRRKRLRKSSTGSGSGSTEQTSEELVNECSGVQSTSLRVENVNDRQRSVSRQSLKNSNQQPSSDSEPREGSQDSGTEEYKRQTSNESRQLSFENRQISIESRQDSRQSSIEGRQLSVEGSKVVVKEERQESRESRLSQESSIESIKTESEGVANLSFGPLKVGTKRGRLLMRQQRVKKESEVHTSPDSDPGSPSFPTMTLTIPGQQPLRQRSEPISSTQTLSPSTQSSSSNLLTVPQLSFPVRQHSYPSQSPIPSGSVYVHRHSQTPTVVKCVSTAAEETPRTTSSPSILMETVPIVRIFSESNLTKTNSFILQQRAEDLKSITETSEINRSGHCPVLRAGPALGCNFCWNTIDAHGRILRRKTKYHCPECQTNLCIVPCFQQYHTAYVENSDRSEQPSPS